MENSFKRRFSSMQCVSIISYMLAYSDTGCEWNRSFFPWKELFPKACSGKYYLVQLTIGILSAIHSILSEDNLAICSLLSVVFFYILQQRYRPECFAFRSRSEGRTSSLQSLLPCTSVKKKIFPWIFHWTGTLIKPTSKYTTIKDKNCK